MSKRLLEFMRVLQSRDDIAGHYLAAFIHDLFPNGEPCDNETLNKELDNLLNLVKEAKNKLKSKRSNSYRGMSIEEGEDY